MRGSIVRTLAEAEEMRAEVGGRVMVLVIRCGAQIGDEEILRRLEVIHIRRHLVDACDAGVRGASLLVWGVGFRRGARGFYLWYGSCALILNAR